MSIVFPPASVATSWSFRPWPACPSCGRQRHPDRDRCAICAEPTPVYDALTDVLGDCVVQDVPFAEWVARSAT